MGFSLERVLPNFFDVNPDSEIWNHSLTFNTSKSYMIHAGSGKGKSSLFNFMTGHSVQYSGRIDFEGVDLKGANSVDLSAFRYRNWSLIFQNLGLFEELTVRENLSFYKDDIDEDSIKYLGLDSKIECICSSLSYGERQRLAILRALSKPFEFIIMDEPFSHLNKDLKRKALDLILENSKKQNAGIILFELDPDFKSDFDQNLRL